MARIEQSEQGATSRLVELYEIRCLLEIAIRLARETGDGPLVTGLEAALSIADNHFEAGRDAEHLSPMPDRLSGAVAMRTPAPRIATGMRNDAAASISALDMMIEYAIIEGVALRLHFVVYLLRMAKMELGSRQAPAETAGSTLPPCSAAGSHRKENGSG